MSPSIGSIAQRIAQLGHMTVTRPFYGFVTGHSHLDTTAVAELERIMASPVEGANIVADYERRFAALVGDGEGIAFAGGRMALYTALKALGIGEGDEVILPAFTCAVVASAVLRTGATPVYTDVDTDTFGTCPEAVEQALTARTRAVVAQHSFGIPCRVDEIADIVKPRGIALIEDCALTLGSTLDGVTVGNFGDAAFFSTDHSKPLNTIVGGMLYTRDAGLAADARSVAEAAQPIPTEQQQRLMAQFRLERQLARPSSYGIYQAAMVLRSVQRKLLGKGMTFLDDDYTVESSGAYPFPARLPAALARLGLYELARWPHESERRRTLLAEYLRASFGTPVDDLLPPVYGDPRRNMVAHRFAYCHPQAEKHRRLMDERVHTAWTWFTVPVLGATGGLASLGYKKGSCPVSERTGRDIINWPCVVEEGCEQTLLEFFKNVARVR